MAQGQSEPPLARRCVRLADRFLVFLPISPFLPEYPVLAQLPRCRFAAPFTHSSSHWLFSLAPVGRSRHGDYQDVA